MKALKCPPNAKFGSIAVMLVLMSFVLVPLGHSRPVFQTPSNWNNTVTPSTGPTDFKSTAINNAITAVANGGGGTVYLAAGNYYLDQPIVIGQSSPTTWAPVYVRLVGAKQISSITPGTGEAVLIWNSTDRTKSVIDVHHCQSPTIENIRIQAHTGQRFKQGIFFHRIDLARVAPTGLALYDIGIHPGAGSFTVGIRLNNVSDPGSSQPIVDQNCDMNHLENIFISGASDDTTLGVNAAGIWTDGSQVQGNYLRNITVNSSGAGVYCQDGQAQLYGGTFSTNILTTAYNNPSGGGDFVYRTGMGGGHAIQDVISQGSYRFYTDYYEDGGTGLQCEGEHALAIANCTVKSLHANNTHGDAIYQRWAGPLAVFNCDFGQTTGLAQKVMQGEWTQGSVMLVSNRFNHSTGIFISNRVERVEGGEPPTMSMVNSRGWNGSTYVNLANQHSDTNNVSYSTMLLSTAAPRAINTSRPIPSSGYVLNLANSFVYNSSTYKLTNGWFDIDNAPIINAAIAKVKLDQPVNGGTIWIPNGVYVIKTQVNLQDVQNVRLMGVGGRNGYSDGDGGAVAPKGTAFAWNGSMAAGSTMIKINRSQNIAVESLCFTTWDGFGYPPSGANTIDRFIHVSKSGTGGYATQNIWLQDVGCRWLCGTGQPVDIGICNTFVQIGDGAGTVNCNNVTVMDANMDTCKEQGALINGSSCTNIQLNQFAATSRRAVQVGSYGGSFTWIGGGHGNSARNYTDPVAIELNGASGPIYVSGLECQEDMANRGLRTSTVANSNKVYMYGVSLSYAPALVDQKLIDFKWTGSGELNLFGCALGYGSSPYTICASNGSKINSVANQVSHSAGGFVWQVPAGSSSIKDLGSRAFLYDRLSWWPFGRATSKYFSATSSTSGRYTLPVSATRGTSINVAWTSPTSHTTHTGDWIGIYNGEFSVDTAHIGWVSLGSATGTSGTTTGTLSIPSYTNVYGHRIFELRFFKGGNGAGGICVHKVALQAL